MRINQVFYFLAFMVVFNQCWSQELPARYYTMENMLSNYHLKFRRNGQVIKRIENFETKRKKNERGKWQFKGDTLELTFKKDKNYYFVIDSCLVSLKTGKCVYLRNKLQRK